MRVAELIDAADHFQIEGIFVNFPCARRQNHADGARRGRGNSFHRSCLAARRTRSLVSSLMDGLFRQVLDTVDGDTPASAATSRMVTATKTAPLCRRWGKSGACTARFRFCPYCKRGRAQCQSCGRNLRKKFAQDDEWNRSLFSPSRQRIRKMSISQLSLL